MSIRKLVTGLVTAVGLLMIVEYYVAIPLLNSIAATLRAWGVIVATFAVGIGTVNLAMVHLRKAQRRQGKGIPSIALLAILLFTILSGVIGGRSSPLLNFVYEGVIQPVNNAIFSLLACFIASAAYRSFRVRNVEASILLGISLIVMLGQMPMSKVLVPSSASIASWITSVLNVAGQRGIIIGTGIAFISLSLRVILGMERQLIGTSDE